MLGWHSLDTSAKVLVLNGLAFNLGFYMLMPYLAQHLGAGLGLAGWAAGWVMGLRVFSQQGLFLPGGWLGDRLGHRRAIIAGCVLRSVGFLLLGWARDLPTLLLAAALTGFAGALFTPSAQACLATLCPEPEHRRSAFSLHNMASQAGMLAGPLLGMLLIRVDFRLAGSAASGLFLVLAWLQWYWLPAAGATPTASESAGASWRRTWRALWRKPALLRFCGLTAVYQLLFHQLYLAVPAYAQQHALGEGTLSAVFTLSALLGVAAPWPVDRWIVPRLGSAASMGVGLMVMGMAFLAPWIGESHPQAALLGLATLLSLGSTLCFPLFSASLPHFSGDLPLASSYGFMASIGGCAALLGHVTVGALLGTGSLSPPSWIWITLGASGLLAGLAMWRLVHIP